MKSQHPATLALGKGPLSHLFQENRVGVMLLGMLTLCSAMGVVYTKHLTRSLHTQLEQLQQLRDTLHVEWTQLLLEQGTLGADVRVEKIAREQLEMVVPAENQVVVIRP